MHRNRGTRLGDFQRRADAHKIVLHIDDEQRWVGEPIDRHALPPGPECELRSRPLTASLRYTNTTLTGRHVDLVNVPARCIITPREALSTSLFVAC